MLDVTSPNVGDIERPEVRDIHPYAGVLPVAVNARWAEGVLLSLALAAVDVVSILGGFRLAYALRFEARLTWLYQPEAPPMDFYTILLLFLGRYG